MTEEAKPTVSVSISRKINLGNFESMDLFLSLNGVSAATTVEEMEETLAQGRLGYELLKRHLRERILDTIKELK